MTPKKATIILTCLLVIMFFFVVYFYNEMKVEKETSEILHQELKKVEDVKQQIEAEEAKRKALLQKIANPERQKELENMSQQEEDELRQRLLDKIK